MKKLRLLRALLGYQWQNERAYVGNFIASLFATLSYSLMFVLFVFFLFERVGQVAGYDRGDMLLLYFLQEVGFFVVWGFIWTPLNDLVRSVNTGQFDLVLARPVPLKSWVQLSGIRPFGMFFQVLPPLVMSALIVPWHELGVTPGRVLAAIVIWLAAQPVSYCLFFMLTLPAFRTGEASDLMHLLWAFEPTTFPYEQLPRFVKVSLFTVMPTVMTTVVVGAVLLGKTVVWPVLIPAVGAGFIAILLQKTLWRWALRGYTSASS